MGRRRSPLGPWKTFIRDLKARQQRRKRRLQRPLCPKCGKEIRITYMPVVEPSDWWKLFQEGRVPSVEMECGCSIVRVPYRPAWEPIDYYAFFVDAVLKSS